MKENALLKEQLKEESVKFVNDPLRTSYILLEAKIIGRDNFLDTPLISTSVNQTGQKPLSDPVQMIKHFNTVDLLIDAGILPESRGSTILDLTENPIKCIRKGDDYQKLIKLGIQMVID